MRRISIFGVTGSVGGQTLDLITRAGGPEAFRTVAVTGSQNIEGLAAAARSLRAEIAVTADPARLHDLRAALAGSGILAAAGEAAVHEAAHRPADWVMSAITGAAGLVPGLRALEQGATLALANKESLVCAGSLVMQTARDHGARILPVDSEHSAIFQALGEAPIETVSRIILTASGGALRDWPLERLNEARVEDALAHPNWSMGRRITIDSASMFNKALEVIEAREFFGIAPDKIEVVIHPESIIHSMVAFRDGAVMAHLGMPDMRHPIGHALNWPERVELPVAPLDFTRQGSLSFRPADEVRWPALRLAREVMAIGGLSGCAFNAAKEVALDHFLDGRLRFTEMSLVVEAALERVSAECSLEKAITCLDEVLAMDRLARIRAEEIAGERAARAA